MLLQMALFHSFLWLSSIPLYILPHFYAFICWWTFRLFSYLCCCESCCYEQKGACVFFFLNIYLAVLGLSYSMLTLSCGMWDLVPWPGIKPRPPALGGWSLSYWTTREVSCMYLFKLQFYPDVCPGVGWLDHVATLFLVSWGTSIVFP